MNQQDQTVKTKIEVRQVSREETIQVNSATERGKSSQDFHRNAMTDV